MLSPTHYRGRDKKNLSAIPNLSTKAACHPVVSCSTPLPIQDRVLIWVSGTLPETITHILCQYPDCMASQCFCSSSCGWAPPIPRVHEANMPVPCHRGYRRSLTIWAVPGGPSLLKAMSQMQNFLV